MSLILQEWRLVMLLQEIQGKFLDFLLTKDHSIDKYIARSENNTEQERLKSYYNSYYLRLIEVLRSTYEYTAEFLGDDFENIAMLYIKNNPSTNYSLDYFGENFSELLDDLELENDYLADLADFEWCLEQIVISATGNLMTTNDLLALDSEELLDTVFKFNESIEIIISNYNLSDFYQKIDDESDDGSEDCEIEFSEEKQVHILWRKGLSSMYKALSTQEELLFKLIYDENSFVECCEVLSDNFETEDLAAEFVSNTLSEWVEEGLFVKNR